MASDLTPTADAHVLQTPNTQPVARPTGVTVLGVLYAIATGFFMLAGLAMLIGGGVLASVLLAALPGWGRLGSLGGVFIMVLGVVVLLIGALFLLVTLGIFKGKAWAWTTIIVIEAIAVVTSLLDLVGGETGAIGGLLIAGLIIWYLFEPAPKAFFGKEQVQGFWQKKKPTS